MKDSTKAMGKIIGRKNAERALHAYLYAKYLTHYVYHMGKNVGFVDKKPTEEIPPEVEEMIEMVTGKVLREVMSAETSTYHGKVVPLKNAIDLVRVEEDVELKNLEKVIPYKIARDIVLENPQNIAVMDCGCRVLHEKPCEPVDVCLAVGDPFVPFVLEHEVLNARKISSDEAVEILEAEAARGHVHCAYFKDVMDGRFYAICNCCPCCCLGMQAWIKAGTPMIAHSGYVPVISDECTHCGDCAEICPFSAIESGEETVVDKDKCMGCGVCEKVCSYDAVTLELEPARGVPLDINKLIEEAKTGQPA